MNLRPLLAAPLLAATCVPAHAQMEGLDRQQMEVAVTYVLPIAFESFATTCRARLAPDGFLARNEGRLQQRFMSAADGTWPKAREVVVGLGERKAAEAGQADAFRAMKMLPDESLRPFVDGMISASIAKEIKPASCADIEEGLRLFDPLPVTNLAKIAGFLFEIMERDKPAERQPGKTGKTQ
ncbi:hypothetical protein [Qipengyuania sp.]|uniref:hypothetical protein n=1 Tax=Qipengyuania sp. TaxID=2004515 RepID=UPI0035C831A6